MNRCVRMCLTLVCGTRLHIEAAWSLFFFIMKSVRTEDFAFVFVFVLLSFCLADPLLFRCRWRSFGVFDEKICSALLKRIRDVRFSACREKAPEQNFESSTFRCGEGGVNNSTRMCFELLRTGDEVCKQACILKRRSKHLSRFVVSHGDARTTLETLFFHTHINNTLWAP